ncbi:ACP phosphodiesterase [Saccharobesus litoralis]|uniref:ACP phosphodiesterase n=1 Tax=Saccharobesus litoralis TaxID=2172099 RepID=A0A2S0VVG3_9ALTE|nr:ACP phosphodiesterase [Saccharobesus litoralis]AWB68162.1 ACP phosphodiesterase [Saccharobesus litoralis]
MNYLAHIHIADYSQTSIVGNLLGDFMKGANKDNFNQALHQGIALHQSVDSFTDCHYSVLALKPLFAQYRRFAGIVIDILFDHILAKHFTQYHSLTLAEFASRTYQQLEKEKQLLTHANIRLPERFNVSSQKMIEMDWLTSYARASSCQQALKRTGQRLKRPVDLSLCWPLFATHREAFEQAFHHFYPELLLHVTRLGKTFNAEE